MSSRQICGDASRDVLRMGLHFHRRRIRIPASERLLTIALVLAAGASLDTSSLDRFDLPSGRCLQILSRAASCTMLQLKAISRPSRRAAAIGFRFAHLARPRSRYVGWQGLLAAGASVNEKDGVSG